MATTDIRPRHAFQERLLAILHVEDGELARVGWFGFLAISLWAGLTAGSLSSMTLFLKQAGPEKLPWIFVVMAVLMVVYSPPSTYLVRKLGIDRFFILWLVVLTAGGFAVYYVLSQPSVSTLTYYAVCVYAQLCMVALYTLFWLFTDDYFDIQVSKRLYPLINGGIAAGGILGGLLVKGLSSIGWVSEIFIAWSVLACLALFPFRVIRRRWRKLEEGSVEDDDDRGFRDMTREVFQAFKASRYAKLFAGTLFLVMLLASLCEYQYMTILEMDRTEEELAGLLGTLSLVANFINLVVNFFLFNKLVLWLRVPNVALIQPLVFLVTFVFLAFSEQILAFLPGVSEQIQNVPYFAAFVAACMGYFAYEGAMTSIDANNQNFLFNALPSKAQKDLRTVLESLCEPVATAFVGVSLLLATFVLPRLNRDPDEVLSTGNLAWIGMALALTAVVWVVFLLRGEYLRATVLNLKSHWLDFSRSSEEVLAALPQAEVDRLAERIGLHDVDEARVSLRVLWVSDHELAIETLMRLLRRADEEQSVHLAPILAEALSSGDVDTVRIVLDALESLGNRLSPAVVQELGHHRLMKAERVSPLIYSRSAWQRSAAAVVLLNAFTPKDNRVALEVVERLLRGNEQDKLNAFGILARSRDPKYAYFVVPFLRDASPKIRHAALRGVAELARPEAGRLVPEILRLLEVSRDPAERLLGLQALERISDSTTLDRLLRLADSFSQYELRRAEQLGLGLGLKSVPTVVSVFRDPSYPYKARSIAARVLGKLSFGQFEKLFPDIIEAEIRRSYDSIYRHNELAHRESLSIGATVLCRYFKDVQLSTVDFILELLSVAGRMPAFELVSSSLRSKNVKVRGNTIETLEQGLEKTLFKKLLPLVDGRSAGDQVEYYREKYQPPPLRTSAILAESLRSSYAMEAAVAAHAFFQPDPADTALPGDDQTIVDRSIATSYLDILRERLRESNVLPLLRETVISFLATDTAPNTVEKLYYMTLAPFFAEFDLNQLTHVARGGTVLQFGDGETIYRRGEASDTFFVVIDGEVEVRDGERSEVRTSTSIFGNAGLFGIDHRRRAAVSRRAAVLRLSAKDMLEASASYPWCALKLLEKRYG